ncbi:unannotated protein [freshwater metagenome]|uniref:Unannotated protein n=1 Tax=freshwater metagenome TaxID=449393 RepID=A0A6J7H1K2_9ZZZZ
MPGTGSVWRDVNNPVGSGNPTIPESFKSKQPTSSDAPNLFLIALINLSLEWRSPSKLSTTSTKCSSSLGPAIEPSLVT